MGMGFSKEKAVPVLALLAGASVWGVIWYPYRRLEQAGLSGELAALCTYGIALLAAVLFLAPALRGPLRQPRLLIAIGVTAGGANVAYVLAILQGEVMRVMLLFYAAPLWTVLFSRLLLGERLARAGWEVMLLALSGAFVMLWEPASGMPALTGPADWLGLAAGWLFALSNVLVRKADGVGVAGKSLAALAGVAAVAGAVGGLRGSLALPDAAPAGAWGLAALVGLALVALTWTVQYGLSRVTANRAIVILLFELVVAALASYALAGERMEPREWLGGALIVAASLLSGKLAGPAGSSRGSAPTP